MKNWKQWTLVAVFAFLGIILTGCETDPEEPVYIPTYTVWTDISTYTEFKNAFGLQEDLDDGYYLRAEIPSSSWSTISQSLTNDGKHRWTESKLKSYFIGIGFGNQEATQAVAWLKTISHGLIASRSGSTVNMLIK